MKDKSKIRVGVGIMVFKNGKVLLSQRKNIFGSGEYQFPGGHLEYYESFEECAKRECMEEADIEIRNIKLLFIANIKKYEDTHYVHLGLTADWKSGTPKTLEPEKSTDWDWYDPTSPPTPLFEATKLSFDAYKTGKIYYDSKDE